MHLTEEQLDDYLIGDLGAEPAAHLGVCEACRLRVREAESLFASFREMSLAWGERRSATMSAPLTEMAPHSRGVGAWFAATTAAAVLAAGFILQVGRHDLGAKNEATLGGKPTAGAAPILIEDAEKVSEPAATATLAAAGHTGMKSVTPVSASPEQIAADNQMLAAIERELDAPRENADAFGLVQAAAGSIPSAESK